MLPPLPHPRVSSPNRTALVCSNTPIFPQEIWRYLREWERNRRLEAFQQVTEEPRRASRFRRAQAEEEDRELARERSREEAMRARQADAAQAEATARKVQAVVASGAREARALQEAAEA